jgi:chromosome segregation ATPase
MTKADLKKENNGLMKELSEERAEKRKVQKELLTLKGQIKLKENEVSDLQKQVRMLAMENTQLSSKYKESREILGELMDRIINRT